MARMDTLQIPVPAELRDRITAIAVAEELPVALVGREVLLKGIAARERLHAKRMR